MGFEFNETTADEEVSGRQARTALALSRLLEEKGDGLTPVWWTVDPFTPDVLRGEVVVRDVPVEEEQPRALAGLEEWATALGPAVQRRNELATYAGVSWTLISVCAEFTNITVVISTRVETPIALQAETRAGP